MANDVQAKRYVVAVSGGVDSVALLHILATTMPHLQLTVAHYDHGIRADSAQDRKLVQALAQRYGLPFVYHTGKLGAGASEAAARTARYNFLHEVQRVAGAGAIVTAHHQDDLLETVILNLLRGTGRRGLSSLRSTDGMWRPLLQTPKHHLLRYAQKQGLEWREDSTNADIAYMRNYIRHRILPHFAAEHRQQLLQIAERAAAHNAAITEHMTNYLHLQPGTHVLNRHEFMLLPHAVARDVLAEWLLLRTGAELNRKLLERLVVAAKTGKWGSRVDVNGQYWLVMQRDHLALEPRER
jgi:tRNA(Ile)-lysidine synthetase-like protein